MMKKRLLAGVCLLALVLGLWLPVTVSGVTPLETDRLCSLSLSYTREGVPFPGMEVRIYWIAAASPDGTYDLVAPYSGYPVNIHGITSQTEWDQVAETLTACIAADQVEPDHTAVTDGEGWAKFEGLQTGLYLVSEARNATDKGTVCFRAFLIYVPTPVDGGYDYDPVAKPKPGDLIPVTEYTLVKLWKDTGSSKSRPDSVTVEIYEDGVLYDTVTLSGENNWSHSWSVPEGGGSFTVMERPVPEGYTVTITSDGGHFTITNSREYDPEEPPDTGDTMVLWPWILSMCLSGTMLLILGIRREKRA